MMDGRADGCGGGGGRGLPMCSKNNEDLLKVVDGEGWDAEQVREEDK